MPLGRMSISELVSNWSKCCNANVWLFTLVMKNLEELPEMVQVRLPWCSPPAGSHQSTNDPAGRLHNTALRLRTEENWAAQKLHQELHVRSPVFLRRLSRSWRLIWRLTKYNRLTIISNTWHMQSCAPHFLCSALPLSLYETVDQLPTQSLMYWRLWEEFCTLKGFLILWQIRHASLQPTLCTSF